MKKNQIKQLAKILSGELKPERISIVIWPFKKGTVDGYAKNDHKNLSFYFESAEETPEIILTLTCNNIDFICKEIMTVAKKNGGTTYKSQLIELR